MRVLHIDEKWSVEYDPENNDRPIRLLRYGEPSIGNGPEMWNNPVTAMFYALLSERSA